MEKEDGEMSDDNMMLVDDEKDKQMENETTVIYKSEKNGVYIENLEKVDAAKLEERAKRFGLNLTGSRVITQTQIDQLYANFGIESGNERHFRFDTLHLKGVDGMSTKEIFEYLEDYKPVSLEWIDDLSCNVVCQDHISVALALLVHSREIDNDKLKELLFDKSHWREGMPHPKKDLILMRFATNGDKKIIKKKAEIKSTDDYFDQNLDSVSKNPWGDLCQSWGVYDHQEILQSRKKDIYEDKEEFSTVHHRVKIQNKILAKRLGKRHVHPTRNDTDGSEDSCSDSEWKKKSKVPRMRMHADDEESKLKTKLIDLPKDRETLKGDNYAPLCIEVTNSQDRYSPRESTKLSDKFKYHNVQKQSIHSRLGEKLRPAEEEWPSDKSSDNSDCNIMSQVQKVNNRTKSTNSVWSRLETKPDKGNVHSDLRQILKSKKQKDKPDDLRDRLGKAKQANLRIEIDNNYLSDS